ncbi:serine/threonine protein kinase [Streptomyces sp. ISL-1]|uniref:protein kinase domain-containing protein n=1 Tax=Streptomyces sp. ISL-1 TaxID=2817657 RepID=UPI001BEC602A|nr:serine/threonine-protein kinase [Streptomyces sp. ISL-1]MBT2392045.1 serine/threonine protein kinase [Streptomyces sp. ISL-1]
MGAFRLLFVLGEGGMGRVYLARSPGGRTVALKTVRAGMAGAAGFRARFAREVRACQSVSGRGTAPVVAAEPQAAVPWLATAYVPGPSLAEAVHEHGPLDVPTLWRLLGGLGEALTDVHRAGLVHRDLKPSNVLLALDGPRLIDFGIARAADDVGLTGTGLVVGSPGFMSPEQVEGKEVDERSDVFALGVLLAYAATGRNPFGSAAGPELGYRVVHHEPDLTAVPTAFAEAIGDCFAKDPAQRPSLAELVARAGAHAAAGPDWLPAPLTASVARQTAWVLGLESRQEFGPPPTPFGARPTRHGEAPVSYGRVPAPGGGGQAAAAGRQRGGQHAGQPIPQGQWSPVPYQLSPQSHRPAPPLTGTAWATHGPLGKPLLGLVALMPLLVMAMGRDAVDAQLRRPDPDLTPASPGWESYQWALDTTWHFSLITPLFITAITLHVLRRRLHARSTAAVRRWAGASAAYWLLLSLTVLVSAGWLRSALWAVDGSNKPPALEMTLGFGLLPLALLVPVALAVMVLAVVRAFRVRQRIPGRPHA